MLLLRFAFCGEELAVEDAFLELVIIFFEVVRFLGVAFLGARFFALDCLPDIGLDFFAFLPFFLVAIFAV